MITPRKWLRLRYQARRFGVDCVGLMCLLALFVLAGCFSLRSAARTPENLRFITLQTDNVFAEITTHLRRRLQAAGISTRNRGLSTITVILRNSTPGTEVPVIFDSLQGTVYRYNMRVTLQIRCNNSIVLRQSTLVATQDVLHNINQISPPVLTPLMRRALIQRLIDNLMNLLTSKALAQEVSTQCHPSR